MEFFGHVIDGQEVESLDRAHARRRPLSARAVGAGRGRRAADADRAVAAARAAFDSGPWPRLGFNEPRQRLLHALADLLERHADDLGMADTRDMGKP